MHRNLETVVKANNKMALTISSNGHQTLRGFLRLLSALLRKHRSAFGSAEHWRYM